MLLLAGTTEPAPDRTGVIDPIQERGKSPNRELGGHELRVPKWAPIRRKTTEKSTNSGSGFDGIGGYFQGFRRGAENCKTFMRRLYRLFFQWFTTFESKSENFISKLRLQSQERSFS